MPLSAPPKFKILVANLAGGSDPSRGTSGNPVKLRTGFQLQMVTLPNGTGRVAGPIQAHLPPTALNHTAAIQVVSATYWDPTVDPPPQFYQEEEVQIFDQYLVASEEFGVGLGSGVGPVNGIATSLATAISSIDGMSASSVGDTVYITSNGPSAELPIKASNDTATLLSGYMFSVLGPSGEVLTSAPQDRKTYYVVRLRKFQSPPVSLP